ncbi:MAG: 23S rRNA (pseudouridine(1915)-N(3))-methyltransferase RlmH [Woeseiaceae bacterium]
MHVRLVAVGDRQPSWVSSAVDDYVSRFPRHWRFKLDAIATTKRNKSESREVAMDAEAVKILARTKPADFVIALDERGRQSTSTQLAGKLEEWQTVGADLVFVIGGPDGLAKDVLERANHRLSLSLLTLPHGLARILFVEQLYRAWSFSAGHPYHRE